MTFIHSLSYYSYYISMLPYCYWLSIMNPYYNYVLILSCSVYSKHYDKIACTWVPFYNNCYNDNENIIIIYFYNAYQLMYSIRFKRFFFKCHISMTSIQTLVFLYYSVLITCNKYLFRHAQIA